MHIFFPWSTGHLGPIHSQPPAIAIPSSCALCHSPIPSPRLRFSEPHILSLPVHTYMLGLPCSQQSIRSDLTSTWGYDTPRLPASALRHAPTHPLTLRGLAFQPELPFRRPGFRRSLLHEPRTQLPPSHALGLTR